jgi:hypothetical protein
VDSVGDLPQFLDQVRRPAVTSVISARMSSPSPGAAAGFLLAGSGDGRLP